jgi:spore coat polysaccharide biosynthesis predicted glycosyltransferase SpsG/RimJ/RimL family protein N-acetyltransferase
VNAAGGADGLRVLIRTAASATIGAGHAARTTAVARELARLGARVSWACDRETVPALVERGVDAGGIAVLECPATAHRSGETQASEKEQQADAREIAALGPTDIVLVDSYQLGKPWLTAMRATGARLAAFDDLRDRPLEADLVVNAAATPDEYRELAPDARTLGGLRHGIIGDPARPAAAGPGDVLIAFGAADPGQLTERTLLALAARKATRGRLVVQLGSTARARAEATVRSVPGATFAPEGPTSPGAPALAIGAAGVGLLERLHAGVPGIVVVAAENQRGLARSAEHAGAVVVVGSPEEATEAAARMLADSQLLARMSAAGRAAVDGRGAARVARELNRLAGVDLRRATLHDAELLHRWRNDPSVRAVSHTTDEIPWETHVRWLESSLARGDRHVLVAERRGRPLGTLRFDVSGDRATVSIAVDPALHGSGLGPAILDAGDAWLEANDARVRTCRAEIRDGNDASVRAFLAAGYLPGTDSYERPVGRRTEA